MVKPSPGYILGSLSEGAGTAQAVTEGVSHLIQDTPPVSLID